ncbi:MAG: BatA domain-containing protein [Opitutales bacterium]
MIVFGNPAFLWGLLLAAGPLIIHLARRRQALPLRFSTLRFLSASGPPRQQQRKPQDILLMALRMLLLIAVVLVLAQPKWVSPRATGGQTDIVYLFDASASMAWAGREGAADALAADIDRRADAGANFGRVVYDVAPRQVDVPGDVTGRELRATFRDFPPRQSAIDVGGALAAALQLLPDGGEIVVVTDAQAGQWEDSALPLLPPGVQLSWLRQASFSQNVALRYAERISAADGRPLLSARLSGPDDLLSGAGLRLVGPGGETLAEGAVAAPDGATAAVTLDLPESFPAWATAELILAQADALAADNRRAVWLAPAPPVPVQVWLPEIDQGQNVKAREARYVASALRVEPRGAGPRFEVTIGGGAGEDAVWYLAGAADDAPAEIFPQLAERVEAGSSIVITPGRNPARLYRYLRETGLISASFKGRRDRPAFSADPFQVGGLPENSPLREIFDADSERGLYLNRLLQYDALALRDDSDANVWLETEDGDPLLIEFPQGQGSVFLFTISLDTSSGDLPVGGAFLPLVRAIFAAAAPPVPSVRELATGSPARRSPEAEPERVFAVTAWSDAVPPAVFNLPAVESTPRATPSSALLTVRAERALAVEKAPPRTGFDFELLLLALALAAFLAEIFLSQPQRPASAAA